MLTVGAMTHYGQRRRTECVGRQRYVWNMTVSLYDGAVVGDGGWGAGSGRPANLLGGGAAITGGVRRVCGVYCDQCALIWELLCNILLISLDSRWHAMVAVFLQKRPYASYGYNGC